MRPPARRQPRRGRCWGGAGLLALAVVLAAGAAAADAPPAIGAEYRTFYGASARLAVWVVAEIHLMLGAFVLGVPIVASILEIVGWRTGEARWDRLARELKESPKAQGQDRIYVHGEKSFARMEKFRKEGIPLGPKVVEGLKKIGADLDIPWPG